MKLLKWLLRVLQGIIIGSGAILPGISGGVLSVVFDLYRPMMALLASPVKSFRKYWRLFLPVIIGWIIGFVVFAKLITLFFEISESVAIWLFIGLIVGTVPSLFKEGGKEGRNRFSWLSLGLCFAVMLSILILSKISFSVKITPSLPWYGFCGILWGLSLVVPGMTSSSILMSLGLFEPMTAGIGALDIGVLLPMISGIAFIALLVPRLINRMFKNHYSLAFHGIIGIVLASTAVIVPLKYTSFQEFIIGILSAAAGFFITYIMDKKLGAKDDYITV
jgi:putative membrane protein